MNEIPADIRERAEAVVRGLCCDTCQFMNGCGCFDSIAQALMQERERFEWPGRFCRRHPLDTGEQEWLTR